MPTVEKTLEKALRYLLATDDAELLAGVEGLAATYGNRVYSELLTQFCGKTFDEPLAKNYWFAALDHRQQLLRPTLVGRGLRPALLDYLVHEVKVLNDPRLLDAVYLENITRSSQTDGLTGLFHQTRFKIEIEKALRHRRREADYIFAVVLFDLDHFKHYNDRCGHLRGDEALRRTAELLRKNLREGDIPARYGGEEFALLLPYTDRSGAIKVAERIRRSIEREMFPGQERLEGGSLTVSGGVAVFPEDGNSLSQLLEAADRELYRAKLRRNTICPLKSDRRRVGRRAVRSLVEYASFSGTLYRPALCQDISPYGMGLGCESPLDPGTTLDLRLARPFWGENLQITATVRQLRRQGEMIYVGLEFDQALDTVEQLIPALRLSAPPQPVLQN